MADKYFNVILQVLDLDEKRTPETIGQFLNKQRAEAFKNRLINIMEGYGEKYDICIKED